jgi:hypothetical protein
LRLCAEIDKRCLVNPCCRYALDDCCRVSVLISLSYTSTNGFVNDTGFLLVNTKLDTGFVQIGDILCKQAADHRLEKIKMVF